jgi:HPr kinase/phosphorylase
MQIHASCASREGSAVLLLGPPGCGKSDMLLRLIDRGFDLLADDRVEVEENWASPPEALAGLLEVRGLGIVCLPFVARAKLALAVRLDGLSERLPGRDVHPEYGIPQVRLDPVAASAPQRVVLALDCALGRIRQHSGAFE